VDRSSPNGSPRGEGNEPTADGSLACSAGRAARAAALGALDHPRDPRGQGALPPRRPPPWSLRRVAGHPRHPDTGGAMTSVWN